MNANIIFYLKSKVEEIFDFGIIINGKNGKYMKLYKISINKSEDDLDNLVVDTIYCESYRYAGMDDGNSAKGVK